MVIDLHGYTLHSAWNMFNTRISDAYYMKQKSVVVITGQGAIMREFQTWCAQNPHIQTWTNAPHNPGSYKISLKRG